MKSAFFNYVLILDDVDPLYYILFHKVHCSIHCVCRLLMSKEYDTRGPTSILRILASEIRNKSFHPKLQYCICEENQVPRYGCI